MEAGRRIASGGIVGCVLGGAFVGAVLGLALALFLRLWRSLMPRMMGDMMAAMMEAAEASGVDNPCAAMIRSMSEAQRGEAIGVKAGQDDQSE
jgi:hypothetical protein